MSGDLESIQKHARKCITVFVALLVLTVITVAVSYIPLGTRGNITVALAIAILKASLVALFFMHLIAEEKTIYRFLVFAGTFLLGLFFLIGWSYGDQIVALLR
ncbi:cytochrome C oxidase subunit IV family protein [Candidatus Methylacidithermus pantelleriae]|uniref:Putative Cytochrome-c oxidase n=1 Tax=Candidatus Methylacidithermus pantelleriae TaxID=2744239 RepID=A0A8J2FMR1_9BACT|nr:cytochrome C oxidase subunit IV family protein [Candidatus Methylacidithermus pantelleriae]CAF0689627.1 putative Cytochrome-c oxidase [Candidatus Methylacidithermus pantelleriae]